jgi:hypothetical protein
VTHGSVPRSSFTVGLCALLLAAVCEITVFAAAPSPARPAGRVGAELTVVPPPTIQRPSAKTSETNDGQAWIAGFGLPAGCNGLVHAFAYDPAGFAYVGGSFTTCGDVGANGVARFALRSRTWSALTGADGGNGVRGDVNSLLLVGDDVYVGGQFDRANVGASIVASSVARWDGENWHALAGPGGEGVSGHVLAMAWFQDSLYIGGFFVSVNVGAPVQARYVARWDGAAWHHLVNGTNGTVSELHVHEGALYVGGEFHRVGENDDPFDYSTPGIARWDGTTWSSAGTYFSPNSSPVISFETYQGRFVVGAERLWSLMGDQWVEDTATGEWEGSLSGLAVAVHGHQLIAHGALQRFDEASGTSISFRGPAVFDGTRWSPLDMQLASGERHGVGMLASCGEVLCLSGTFPPSASTPEAYLGSPVTWQSGVISPMGPGEGEGTPNMISAVLVNGTDVYVGGEFTRIGGISANGIARWDGRRWWPVGDAFGDGVVGLVRALAWYQGELHAAGAFFRIDEGVRTDLGAVMRWDGSSWQVVGDPALSAGTAGIRSMVEWRGELYVGGKFGSQSSVFTHDTLMRWNGTEWRSLPNAARAYGRVNALAVKDDSLHVGGIVITSSTAGASQTYDYVVRWDGEAWHRLASATGAGVNQEVYSLLADGSDLYVGGPFSEANVGDPIATPRLARWDGGSWHAVGSNPPPMLGIRAIAKSGDSLYIGSGRATAGELADGPLFARWDGNEWSTLGRGFDGRIVSAIAIYPEVDGVVVGGDFGAVDGVASSNIAMFGTDPLVFRSGFESMPGAAPR